MAHMHCLLCRGSASKLITLNFTLVVRETTFRWFYRSVRWPTDQPSAVSPWVGCGPVRYGSYVFMYVSYEFMYIAVVVMFYMLSSPPLSFVFCFLSSARARGKHVGEWEVRQTYIRSIGGVEWGSGRRGETVVGKR